ncbi:AlpA family phage regulatory protein [Mesorhizobium australicum]|uniref:AlpA family phage regulatory protein n=1 Tax=Mesorhizobium australicum TaxID=536018 RepID=A0ACC6STY9_9HYPH
MTSKLLRFVDLAERGIVKNWPQLRRLVDKNDFPPGRMLGENSRFWTEPEIEAWLASRPLAVKREEAA